MRYRLWTILSLAALIPSLWAQGYNQRLVQRLGQDLNLSTSQQQSILDIRKSYMTKLEELRQKKLEARLKLDSALLAYDTAIDAKKAPDAAPVLAAHQQFEQDKLAEKQLRYERMLKIRALLTPEQRQKFEASKRGFDRDEEMGPRAGRRGRR